MAPGLGAGIDTDLYSRQIGTLGMETMVKLMQMKVLISGLRGLGAEIAKNLILAGPKAVILHDDGQVETRDLGANFYLNEAQVGRTSRGEASASQLKDLNPYVAVSVHRGTLTEELVAGCSVVVLTDSRQADLLRWDAFCRQQMPAVGFISADCFGLAGRVFVDFGDAFTVLDKDGEEPKSAIVAGITQESPGIVYTHSDRRHGFQDGDWVVFREVQGMMQLNDSKPRPIKVTGPHSFTIEDTTGYSMYSREGVVSQVKMPETLRCSSYERACEQPRPADGPELHTPDLSKFGRSEQLHLAILALQQYREVHGALPPVRDAAAASECLKLARELNEARRRKGEADLSVSEIDESVLRNTVTFARCMISPMAAFLGGLVAQEVVKFTGKYTPLHQMLYFDMFELLPATEASDCSRLQDSRYADQVAIFGEAFQKALGDFKLFLVGAGALGCEYLKCFAMLGAGVGPTGCITVTDMDRIEISNLNLQFLFRQADVGRPKATSAAAAALRMNGSLNLKSREVRVGPETEETFDDAFWESLDCVVNALDNVQARMYIDSRCVWFAKPLLEAGTLGTKANAQVILPFATQSYSDSQDPPEESIPLCTLKHFPNAIEHTIEWSRDFFEQLFVESPKEVNAYITDPPTLLSKVKAEGSSASQLSRLRAIRRMLEPKTSFDACVHVAMTEFQEKYHDSIVQLLHTFPLHHVTGEGQAFWSGPKRAPSPIAFAASEDLHLDFVFAASNLYAHVLGVQQCRDRERVRSMAKQHEEALAAFEPKEVRIKVDEAKDAVEDKCDEDDASVEVLFREMQASGRGIKAMKPLQVVEFEKDDDSNLHIAFIAASANLRARNYTIGEADFQRVKMIAGRIIPAMATTTAMVTGLVAAELLKIVTLKSRKVEDFKNSFVNLALPLFVLSEPLPPVLTTSKDFNPILLAPVRAKPEGFSTWDKVFVNIGDATLKEFTQFMAKEHNLEVSILSSGSACLYNSFLPSHKARLSKKVSELYNDISQHKLTAKRSHLVLEVSASDADDGSEVTIPPIRFQFAPSASGAGGAAPSGCTRSAPQAAGAAGDSGPGPVAAPAGGGLCPCARRRARP